MPTPQIFLVMAKIKADFLLGLLFFIFKILVKFIIKDKTLEEELVNLIDDFSVRFGDSLSVLVGE